ncbi:MAG: hypothetical protein RL172_1967 [Bacteroidota bacterium]|jgi:hypothetical protein
MKRLFTLLAATIVLTSIKAQGIKGLIDKATKKDSTGKTVIDKAGTILPAGKTGNGLSNEDIVSGLKEALRVGTDSSAKRLGNTDGFFGDAAIKILMPPEATEVESKLRKLGMGKMVDKAILSMNRAAEDAASGVGDIFWHSIKKMTVEDGLQLLKGGDNAATEYLKKTTSVELTEKFRPIIEQSLTKVEATKYWDDVFTKYNMFASKKVNTDLTAYVTDKALAGLFYNIALEEQKIRKDPAAQVTGILKKVFGR